MLRDFRKQFAPAESKGGWRRCAGPRVCAAAATTIRAVLHSCAVTLLAIHFALAVLAARPPATDRTCRVRCAEDAQDTGWPVAR